MFFELIILTIVICVGITSLVIVIGLTSAGLLVCADKWGMLRAWEGQQVGWLIKRCDFCAGYWLSVLLVVMSGASLCSLLGLSWPWYWVGVAVPVGLPAAAICRAVVGPL
jgi:hypothetical protein